jgi:hypothetical protein
MLDGVVFNVSAVVAVPPLAIVTDAGFRLQAGRFCAFAGEVVSAQLRLMVPAYDPAVKVTVAVALDPGETGDGAEAVIRTGETLTVVVPIEGAYVPSPE